MSDPLILIAENLEKAVKAISWLTLIISINGLAITLAIIVTGK